MKSHRLIFAALAAALMTLAFNPAAHANGKEAFAPNPTDTVWYSAAGVAAPKTNPVWTGRHGAMPKAGEAERCPHGTWPVVIGTIGAADVEEQEKLDSDRARAIAPVSHFDADGVWDGVYFVKVGTQVLGTANRGQAALYCALPGEIPAMVAKTNGTNIGDMGKVTNARGGRHPSLADGHADQERRLGNVEADLGNVDELLYDADGNPIYFDSLGLPIVDLATYIQEIASDPIQLRTGGGIVCHRHGCSVIADIGVIIWGERRRLGLDITANPGLSMIEVVDNGYGLAGTGGARIGIAFATKSRWILVVNASAQTDYRGRGIPAARGMLGGAGQRSLGEEGNGYMRLQASGGLQGLAYPGVTDTGPGNGEIGLSFGGTF